MTVTPPAEAVAGNIRFSRRDNCRVEGSLEYFDQLPKTIYAHFDYDNWLPGVQWSGVWVRDGEPLYVETHIWDGSTGGCGFWSIGSTKSTPEGAPPGASKLCLPCARSSQTSSPSNKGSTNPSSG
ncbi:MAG: hypothetical protein HW378_5023, partial [Anaerolineales bacterium]|nr:hypothetical protein [Anaerolineales bacterium]